MAPPARSALLERTNEPPEAHQWVGVPPCVRSGMKALFGQCEDQRRQIEAAAEKNAHLERSGQRLEKRCEALTAIVEETRSALADGRREAEARAEEAFRRERASLEEVINDLARRPSRDEVERLVANATRTVEAAFATRLDAAERRTGESAVANAAKIASSIAKREDETRKGFKKALDAQRRWLAEAHSAEAASRRDEHQRSANALKSLRADADGVRLRLAVVERHTTEESRRLAEVAEAAAVSALEFARDAVSEAADASADGAAAAIAARSAPTLAADGLAREVARLAEDRAARAAAAEAAARAADEDARGGRDAKVAESLLSVRRRCEEVSAAASAEVAAAKLSCRRDAEKAAAGAADGVRTDWLEARRCDRAEAFEALAARTERVEVDLREAVREQSAAVREEASLALANAVTARNDVDLPAFFRSKEAWIEGRARDFARETAASQAASILGRFADEEKRRRRQERVRASQEATVGDLLGACATPGGPNVPRRPGPPRSGSNSSDDDLETAATGKEREAFGAIAKALRRGATRDRETRDAAKAAEKALARRIEDAEAGFRAAHGDLERRVEADLRADVARSQQAAKDATDAADALRSTVAACDAKLSVALDDLGPRNARAAKLAADAGAAARAVADLEKRCAAQSDGLEKCREAVRHVAARATHAKAAAERAAEDARAARESAKDDALVRDAADAGDAARGVAALAARVGVLEQGGGASTVAAEAARDARAAAAAAADVARRGRKRSDADRSRYDALVQDVATLTRLTQSTLEVIDTVRRDEGAAAPPADGPPPPWLAAAFAKERDLFRSAASDLATAESVDRLEARLREWTDLKLGGLAAAPAAPAERDARVAAVGEETARLRRDVDAVAALTQDALGVVDAARSDCARRVDAAASAGVEADRARDARVASLQTTVADLQRRYAALANTVASLYDALREPPPPPPPDPEPVAPVAPPAEDVADALERERQVHAILTERARTIEAIDTINSMLDHGHDTTPPALE